MRIDGKKFIYCNLIIFIYLVFLTCTLEAATLAVGSSSGFPGDKDIPIPIDLSSTPGEEVAGFNFDLSFDASRISFQEVTIGPKAKEANKSLTYIQRSADVIRVMVVGFNQNIIENGEVLNFTFDILDSAPNGKAELIIIDPSISDPAGKLLSVTTEDGEIIVEGSSSITSTTTTARSPITVPTTVRTTTSTSVQPPIPDTTTSTTDKSTSSTTSTHSDSSSTTTSRRQLWPLLYDKMWGSKCDRNLLLLRTFRDELLVNTQIGREYISMIYGNSLEIALLLLSDPSTAKNAGEVIDELLYSVESLLCSDEMIISQETIDDVESLLSQVEPKASPRLKSVIKKVRKDIREEIVFKQLGIGISFFRQD